jgi:MscS family membrane protein
MESNVVAAAMMQPTFGLDQVEFLQSAWAGHPLWQYAASAAWIALAFAVSWLVDFIITRVVQRLTARTETKLDDKLVEGLHKPVKTMGVLLMLRIGLFAYEWPANVEHVLAVILGLAIWVTLAFVLAPIVDFLMGITAERFAAKTATDLDDKILEILHKPVKWAVILVVVNFGIHAYEWPAVVSRVTLVLFTIGLAVVVIVVAMKMLDLLLDRSKEQLFVGDQKLAGMMLPIISRTLKVFVIITGALSAAQYLGIPVTSVIAGLGVGGIAVALAAQNTLANIFGSVTILIDRPFRVGDFVKITGFEGNVEEIGLRSTRIRTPEGHWVTLPNKVVVDAGITNITRRPNIRHAMTLGLTYNTSAERVEEAVKMLREIFQAHPLTHDVLVYWRDYSASSLDIFIVYWCKTTDFKQFLATLEEINVTIKKRFDAAGLEFAYPTQTIQLRQMSPNSSAAA